MGYGQTWTDEGPFRFLGTTYKNNTNKPIQVAVSGIIWNAGVVGIWIVYINGNAFIDSRAMNNTNGQSSANLFFIVPPGSTYQIVDSGTIAMPPVYWYELR